MNPIHHSFKESLDVTLDDDAKDRLWGGVTKRRRVARVRRQALASLGAAATLFVFVLLMRGSSSRGRVPALAVGPLRTEGGGLVGVLSAGDHARPFALDDSSVIELDRGARLETQDNSATAFSGHLTGSGTFSVKPGGPRRWSIVCNLVTVDVIGTRFRVEDEGTSGAPRVRVSVEHGIVLVRGEAVPGHVQRLIDGQSLDVTGDVTAPPRPVSSANPPLPNEVPRSLPSDMHAERTTKSSWHDLARGGDYEAAYRQLGPHGVAAEASRASVDELLELADVARLSAHPADAVTPLSRVMNEHGEDSRASLAAFTLGRIELDTLGEPAGAAGAFRRAIHLGLPEGLTEDAYARLVEAEAKAGDRAAARGARDEYVRTYPHGSRSSTMERWVSGD